MHRTSFSDFAISISHSWSPPPLPMCAASAGPRTTVRSTWPPTTRRSSSRSGSLRSIASTRLSANVVRVFPYKFQEYSTTFPPNIKISTDSSRVNILSTTPSQRIRWTEGGSSYLTLSLRLFPLTLSLSINQNSTRWYQWLPFLKTDFQIQQLHLITLLFPPSKGHQSLFLILTAWQKLRILAW